MEGTWKKIDVFLLLHELCFFMHSILKFERQYKIVPGKNMCNFSFSCTRFWIHWILHVSVLLRKICCLVTQINWCTQIVLIDLYTSRLDNFLFMAFVHMDCLCHLAWHKAAVCFKLLLMCLKIPVDPLERTRKFYTYNGKFNYLP